MSPRRIIFFSPEGLFHPHIIMMGLMARTMRELGHDVFMAACHGSMRRCEFKYKEMIDHEAGRARIASVCQDCSTNVETIGRAYDVPVLDLRPYFTTELSDQIDALIARCGDRPQDFVLDGIPLGQTALADLVLNWKLLPEHGLADDHIVRLRESIHAAACIHVIVGHLIATAGVTDVVVYGTYAANTAAVLAAWRHNANARILGSASLNGIDRRIVTLQLATGYQHTERLLRSWPRWRSNPLLDDQVAIQGDDLINRFGGRTVHVFSPQKTVEADLRKTLDLPYDRPLIAVYTSSPDENVAIEAREVAFRRTQFRLPSNRTYGSQTAWLGDVVAVARKRPDWSFVVRIHPRENANKRDGRRSQHLDLVLRTLENIPSNVRVIEPQSSISSYDLMETADLVMVSWSSIGLEAASLGIPTLNVMQEQVPCPPDEFMDQIGVGEPLESAIERAITTKPTIARIALAFRWFYLSRAANGVSFDDVITTKSLDQPPPFKIGRNARLFEHALLETDTIEDRQLYRQSSNWSADLANESAAIRRVLLQIMRFLFTGKIEESGQQAVENGDTMFVSSMVERSGSWCTWREHGQDIRRFSPLAARLADLL